MRPYELFLAHMFSSRDPGDFPFRITVESTNLCNLRCPICPREDSNRGYGYVDFDLFSDIARQAAGRESVFYRQGFGEPFLHPRFQEEIYPLWLPYELMVLGTALSEGGYAVRIVDERGDPNAIEGLVDEVEGALFVGISSRPGDQVIRAMEIFRLLEDHHSEVPAVWGGWSPSSFPDACLAIPEVDFVVQGAADSSIVALAERLRLHDGDVSGVPGLNGGLPGRAVIRNPRRRLENIDATPRVEWSRFPIADFITPDGCLSYYTNRGCPRRCRFCGVTRLYPASWTGYSPERVLDDIELFVHRYGVRILKTWDVDFFSDVDRTLAICRGIVKRGFRSVGSRTSERRRRRSRRTTGALSPRRDALSWNWAPRPRRKLSWNRSSRNAGSRRSVSPLQPSWGAGSRHA